MLPLEYRFHRGGWPTFRQLFLFPEVSEGAPAGVTKAGFPSEKRVGDDYSPEWPDGAWAEQTSSRCPLAVEGALRNRSE
jgi:hypothetical protein